MSVLEKLIRDCEIHFAVVHVIKNFLFWIIINNVSQSLSLTWMMNERKIHKVTCEKIWKFLRSRRSRLTILVFKIWWPTISCTYYNSYCKNTIYIWMQNTISSLTSWTWCVVHAEDVSPGYWSMISAEQPQCGVIRRPVAEIESGATHFPAGSPAPSALGRTCTSINIVYSCKQFKMLDFLNSVNSLMGIYVIL